MTPKKKYGTSSKIFHLDMSATFRVLLYYVIKSDLVKFYGNY